jgi:hypothetical protein
MCDMVVVQASGDCPEAHEVEAVEQFGITEEEVSLGQMRQSGQRSGCYADLQRQDSSV